MCVIKDYRFYSWSDKRKSPRHFFTKCHIIFHKYIMNINKTQGFMQHANILWYRNDNRSNLKSDESLRHH